MLTLRDIELLEELQHTENGYRLTLSKLFGSCSPLKTASPQTQSTKTTSVSTQLTNATRRLVAHHQALHQLFCVEDIQDSYPWLVSWLERGIPVYNNYIGNYSCDSDTLPIEVQLRKQPLQRLNSLYKMIQKLEHVPEAIVMKYERLVDKAKDTVEQQNLSIDLNTVFFDSVRELDDELSSTVAYFKIDDIVERDYFEMQLIHPSESHKDEQLVEVFTLKNGMIAICLVKTVGRSLMFPPLRLSDYTLRQNDTSAVVIARDSIEIRLRCPDQRQMSHWNQTFTHLSYQIDNRFAVRHAKLSQLKKGRVGLGLHTGEQTMGCNTPSSLGSNLRKSTPMIVKHNSLIRNESQISSKLSNVDHYFSASNKDLHKLNSYTDSDEEVAPQSTSATPEIKETESSSHLDELQDLSDYVRAIEATFSPAPKNTVSLSPVQPLNVRKQLNQGQNDSVVSLPNIKHSEAAVELNKKFAQSVGDLSHPQSALAPSHKTSTSSLKPISESTPTKKEKTKMKRRKSIFGLFSKKNDEPSFEIVTKSSIPASTSSGSIASSLSNHQPASMASLHRSVQNLNIKQEAMKKSSQLPAPFTQGSPSTSKAQTRDLSPAESEVLSTSNTSRAITNSCVVSKWASNKWQAMGKPYLNELRFLHNTSDSTLVIFTDLSSEVPTLFIPLTNPHTNICKSSALDLQIRCPQSLDSTHIHILTLRCCDSKTVSLILEEFHMAQGKSDSGNSTRETISNSSTVLFDKPSNSTSMSSVSLMEENWAPPQPKALYGMSSHSNSTLSLKSSETTQASSAGLGELLLKSDIKVRLHKQDDDGDWMPVSMGKFSIASSVSNPEYSRFVVKCVNASNIETLVKNSLCTRLGKSGLRFPSIGEEGQELQYLVEFKNEKECKGIHELLI
ncbi:CYFA0S20e01090g1_1 [Cyberlindnera fabianii]|uniref:CYFA0S20e01090g1_1 n=1 Tax=Cyberlindnera fabianii TaxID=36022 RepID=A0A061B7I0_CYBFA|nr:hypothetical protein BON22_0878 [Cyberlindnera fabianii]CDR45868.1 CYFA0S20e01090g1_1 [Cyberlindnera fabianii]